ncbi:hypothetical protein L7F22_011828 [Adiantum nelumboides]|nr:hypothetical protein [Adiantum nelumboides]
MADVEALPESRLGTKEYWDSTYERELKTYAEIGDEGEVWFGEEAVERMVDYLDEERNEGDGIAEQPTVLDLGNGHLLFALAEMEPPLTEPSRMLGIDYSPSSIQLSKRIADKRGPACCDIGFEVYDFLDDANIQRLRTVHDGGWDLICDKGTLDAIALSKAKESSEDPVKRYASSVAQICKPGTLFVITSCNFTEQELRLIFEQGFQVHHVVPTPSFSFVSTTLHSDVGCDTDAPI